MSVFRCLGHTRVSLQVWGFVNISNKDTFSRWGVVSPSPNPQAGGQLLVGCPRLLIQYIRGHPPYWRLFLHPHPEDATCDGDRDPLITLVIGVTSFLTSLWHDIRQNTRLHRVHHIENIFSGGFHCLHVSVSCPCVLN
jgi:hypothetical protein